MQEDSLAARLGPRRGRYKSTPLVRSLREEQWAPGRRECQRQDVRGLWRQDGVFRDAQRPEKAVVQQLREDKGAHRGAVPWEAVHVRRLQQKACGVGRWNEQEAALVRQLCEDERDSPSVGVDAGKQIKNNPPVHLFLEQ